MPPVGQEAGGRAGPRRRLGSSPRTLAADVARHALGAVCHAGGVTGSARRVGLERRVRRATARTPVRPETRMTTPHAESDYLHSFPEEQAPSAADIPQP